MVVCPACAWSLGSIEELVQQRVGTTAGPTSTSVDIVDVGCSSRDPVVLGLSCVASASICGREVSESTSVVTASHQGMRESSELPVSFSVDVMPSRGNVKGIRIYHPMSTAETDTLLLRTAVTSFVAHSSQDSSIARVTCRFHATHPPPLPLYILALHTASLPYVSGLLLYL